MNLLPDIYLNSSEHILDLAFSDNLMLSNYARSKNFKLCSMIGGAESLRDLLESKNLFSEAYEFPMIESIFAVEKIFGALKKVFYEDLKVLNSKKIFINISSNMGLDLIEEIENLVIPGFFNRENLIFNFDRRSITLSQGLVNNDDFELNDFESLINSLIKTKVNKIAENEFQYSISGGINNKSISQFKKYGLKPNFIKTGIFTIKSLKFDKDLFKHIYNLQVLERKLMSLMNQCIMQKHEYLKVREMHLSNYLTKL